MLRERERGREGEIERERERGRKVIKREGENIVVKKERGRRNW